MNRFLAPAAAGATVAACVLSVSLAVHTAAPRLRADHRAGAPEAVASATVSDADLAALKADGDTVTPIADDDTQSRTDIMISSAEALKSVSSRFAFLSRAHAASITLARLTDAKYGDPVPPSTAEGKTTITPIVNDRLVWLVVFDDFAMPYFGPRGSAPTSADSTSSRMWIAVDAVSGNVIGGRSISGDVGG